MFMTDGTIDQSGEGSAAKPRLQHAPGQGSIARGKAALVARVRPVRTSGIPVSGRSDTSGRAGRSFRDYGTDYTQASGGHGAYSASLCEEQWADDRRDRDTCVGRVSEYSEKAWLSRAQGTALSKSRLTIGLIDCTTRSSRRPTAFWCRCGSVRWATV